MTVRTWAVLVAAASMLALPVRARAAEDDSDPTWWPLAASLNGCGPLRDRLVAADGTIRPAAEGDAYQILSSATTDRCRQAVERNEAPEITGPLTSALLRGAASSHPDAAAVTSEIALCVLRPRTSWAVSWMLRSATQRTAPVCLAALAESDRPEAKRLVEATLNHLFLPSTTTVADPFVLQAAAFSPLLRARLRGFLPKANRLRADNFRDMWEVACFSADGTALGPACDQLAPDDRRGPNQSGSSHKLIATGFILAVAGAAVAGGVASRNDDGGLAIATMSAAVGGGLLLATVADLSVTGGSHANNGTEHATLAVARIFYDSIFGIVGGVAGGAIAYEALKGSSQGRAATTVVGAATASLCSIRFVWN